MFLKHVIGGQIYTVTSKKTGKSIDVKLLYTSNLSYKKDVFLVIGDLKPIYRDSLRRNYWE